MAMQMRKRLRQPLTRRLRLEPLEQRLQLSATIFEDFSSASGLTLNGTAQVTGGRLRLTAPNPYTAASAWFDQIVDVDDFLARFEFELQHSPGQGIGPGDGFTFALLNAALDGSNSLGENGGALGYAKLGGTSLSGFAIEFDTYHNPEFSDPNRVHIGLDLQGSVHSQVVSNPLPISLVNGGVLRAEIQLQAGQLNVRIGPSGGTAYTVLTTTVPGSAIPQDARIGFTGSTGQAMLTTSIDDFSFGSLTGDLINEQFNSDAAYTTLGDATTSNGELVLTEGFGNASAVWFSTPVGTDTLTATFQFRIDQPLGLDFGDGFTFAVIDPAVDPITSTLGDNGASLGYAGSSNAAVDSGFAIEFDAYHNDGIDPEYPHTALNIAGSVDSVFVAPQAPTELLVDIANGELMLVQITWNQQHVDVFLTGPSRPSTHILRAPLPAGAFPSNARVGFTGATGQAAERVRIDNFRLFRGLPPVPTGLAAAATSPTSIRLAWTPAISAGNYFLDRAMSPDGPFQQVAIKSATQTLHIDQDAQLLPSTTYYYRVRTVSGGVSSLDSAVAMARTLSDEVAFNSGPRVINPVGGDSSVAPFGVFDQGVSFVDITFSEAVQNLQTDDVAVVKVASQAAQQVSTRRENPRANTPIAVTFIEPLGGSKYRIHFDEQTAVGNYLVAVGPSVVDLDGAPMNQDGDTLNGESVFDRFLGTFSIAHTAGDLNTSLLQQIANNGIDWYFDTFQHKPGFGVTLSVSLIDELIDILSAPVPVLGWLLPFIKLGFVEVNFTTILDLADLMGATADGRNGWTTIWLVGGVTGASLGLEIPIWSNIGFGTLPIAGGDDPDDDPSRGWTYSAVGGSTPVFEMTFGSSSDQDGFDWFDKNLQLFARSAVGSVDLFNVDTELLSFDVRLDALLGGVTNHGTLGLLDDIAIRSLRRAIPTLSLPAPLLGTSLWDDILWPAIQGNPSPYVRPAALGTTVEPLTIGLDSFASAIAARLATQARERARGDGAREAILMPPGPSIPTAQDDDRAEPVSPPKVAPQLQLSPSESRRSPRESEVSQVETLDSRAGTSLRMRYNARRLR